jgi:flagellar hook-associated protein FlgK
MSDMLGISSGAIGAYQRALTTVSNNIANVNTEGYSRQDVVLQDSAPKKLASMYIGTGVMLQSIKRQYDAFAESNLRSSTSDLSSQKPMVDYAKRVMDIMGDKSIGLSSAFDDFFAAAGALSTDPASTVQRTSFLRSADGVASRFGELSSQLDLISTETRQGLVSATEQVNTLTSQLALINQGLAKSPTFAGQPAELLDRRDLTLRQLSDLVRTKVTFTANGSVVVSLGSTMTDGLVVNGTKARPIGINSSVKDKVELVLDPYGQTETLSSVSGGQIGGYQSFISQVLEPAQKNLSALAKTFATEANAIQKNGIDGYGQIGQDLFSFAPGVASDAAAIRLALSDGMRVSTAAQFRVSEGNTNVTTTRASVRFTGATPSTALSNTNLVNNPNKTAGVSFKVDGAAVYTPVTTLSAGAKATFYLDEAEPGQQLQVLTRDGRQLLGQALTETEKYQLLKPSNGFAANATYSDAYLNKSGVDAYRGLDMFYGAKATVLYGQNLDQNGFAADALPIPAVLESGRIASADFNLAAGAMQLNGIALSKFTPDTTGTNVSITGLKFATPSPDFNFRAVLGDLVVGKTITAPATDNLIALAAELKTQLEPMGLSVSLVNNDQDLRIVDSRGRDISGVSLTPTTGATLSGAAFGSVGTELGFSTFSATVGGVQLQVSGLTAIDMPELARQINAGLRSQDKQDGLSVALVGSDIVLQDTMGRSFSDVVLSATTGASGAQTGAVTFANTAASGGDIQVTSAASQVASWMNGVSKATIVAPTFGSATSGSFSEFKATIGNVGFVLPIHTVSPNNIAAIAREVQAQLRQLDKSSNISVTNESGNLLITDAAGRKFENFELVPSVGSEATGGTVRIDNSTLSQTDVRAEVFSEIRVPVAQLQFKKPLILNGQTITGYKTVDDLVAVINKSPAGLVASVSSGGELVIENPQGTSIRVGSTPEGNALNIEATTYSAQVRMVQMVRDIRVPASGIDFKKPLQINNVNFGEAAYSVPTTSPSTTYTIDFGYPAQSVSAQNAAALAKAINSTATLSGVTYPANGTTVAFSAFDLTVDGKKISLTDLTATNWTDLRDEIQAGLDASDEAGPDVTVSLSADNKLVFTDAQGRAVVPVGLTTTEAGKAASASAGNTEQVMSKSYHADVVAGRLVITPLDASVSDADIANAFVVKSGSDTLSPQTTVKTLDALVKRINAKNLETGVAASIDENGDLKLSVTDVNGKRSISIGPGKEETGKYAQNALGMEPLDYDVKMRLKSLLAAEPHKADIRLSFGSFLEGTPPVQHFGDPSELAKIGFRTGAYIEGGCPDDLLLFMTGKGAANVSVGFSGEPSNVRDSLRSQTLAVKFTAADRYAIIDTKTGTELADRHYDPSVLEPIIEFQGLQLKLSHAPNVGDSYAIDGNYDGLGNNVNMLDMVDLNKKPVTNGKTIANTYIDQINSVGNLAQQATITQQALTVVNDQAVAARDKVAGVNLDDEAAALIRYQQAYQACAKALQISGELFDTINQIR